MHPWLNWIEHLTTDQEVAGSNPAGCTEYLVFKLRYTQTVNANIDEWIK